MYTAFTVTVDARHGISTGISAEDRTRTVRHNVGLCCSRTGLDLTACNYVQLLIRLRLL